VAAFFAHSSVSQETDSDRAGLAIGKSIIQSFKSAPLRAAVVYATVNHDQAALLRGVREAVGPGVTVVGCSAQGVMGNGVVDEGGFVAGAMGLGGDALKVAAARVDDVQIEGEAKGRQLVRTLNRELGRDPKLMLTMYDPLCGIDVNDLLAGVQKDNRAVIVGAAAGQPAGPAGCTYQYQGT
jgi:hypothetical protein